MSDEKDSLELSPFFMQPRKAIEASENGLCGNCGEKIEGEKYHSTVFIRTVWGPSGRSLESSGYRMPIFICKKCKLGDLQFELLNAGGRMGRLKKEIDEIQSSGETANE